MKKIFENAVWWLGVVMAGLILGISLQFVRAWTEPTVAPPNGNVGAPINTSIIEQLKLGALGINGLLKLYGGLQVPAGPISGTPQPGYVLTAQADPLNPAISNGQVAWAAGGGGESKDNFSCDGSEWNYLAADGFSSANYLCCILEEGSNAVKCKGYPRGDSGSEWHAVVSPPFDITPGGNYTLSCGASDWNHEATDGTGVNFICCLKQKGLGDIQCQGYPRGDGGNIWHEMPSLSF